MHFPVHCEPPLSAERKIRRNCRHKLYPQPFLIPVFNFSHKRPTFAFTPESGYTLGLRRKIAHKRLHAETGGVSDGVLLLPSDCFTRFGKPAWPGIRTAHFAVFGSWPGVRQKDAENLRDSDALMRVAVPRRRGPVGLRDLFQFGDVAVFSLCAQYFLNVRGRGVFLPSACFACSRNAGRPLAKAANLPFSEVGWSSLIPVAQKQKQHLTANSPGSL